MCLQRGIFPPVPTSMLSTCRSTEAGGAELACAGRICSGGAEPDAFQDTAHVSKSRGSLCPWAAGAQHLSINRSSQWQSKGQIQAL